MCSKNQPTEDYSKKDQEMNLAFKKAQKVIVSCKTVEQWYIAEEYYRLFKNMCWKTNRHHNLNFIVHQLLVVKRSQLENERAYPQPTFKRVNIDGFDVSYIPNPKLDV